MQWMTIIAILAGIIGGLAVGFQGPISSLMSQRIGMLPSVFMVHLSGAVIALALIVASFTGFEPSSLKELPWYAYVSGAFGVIIICCISFAMPRIGVAATVTAIVVGELLLSAVIDHFGWFSVAVQPIDMRRLAGLAVLILGTYLMVK